MTKYYLLTFTLLTVLFCHSSITLAKDPISTIGGNDEAKTSGITTTTIEQKYEQYKAGKLDFSKLTPMELARLVVYMSEHGVKNTGDDNFCQVASLTFVGLIEGIEKVGSKYQLGTAACNALKLGYGCENMSLGKAICMGNINNYQICNSDDMAYNICRGKDFMNQTCYAGISLASALCRANNKDFYACYSIGSHSKLSDAICSAHGNCGITNNTTLNESICYAGGKSRNCYNLSNLGEAICTSITNSPSCKNVIFNEGVCKAGGGSDCSKVETLEEALCKASGETKCNNIDMYTIIGFAVQKCGVDVLYKFR